PPGISADEMRLLAAPKVVEDAGAGRIAEEQSIKAPPPAEDPGLAEGDLQEADEEGARAIAAARNVN
ncbi:MAG TPA: hypothetical protein VNH64_08530, partial [Parvularculaceae bacterium]|nr:hypothetical protein [Parvularculaceae bacterium]